MSLSFLAPQFLWALLALPLVVILHFIRARKKRLSVSALFLWQKAKEQAQRKRRFSPTWLLLLQLLFAALAALALAQPSLQLGSKPDRILVIDASASMAAQDSDGVRLEKAVAEADSLLRGAGRVAVVRAGLDAVVIQPLSTDHNEVRTALSELVAADERADLKRALELAASIGSEPEVYLLSDEPLPAAAKATLVSVAGDGENLGVSAFELRNQQVFVSVANSSRRPQQVDVEVTRGEQLVASTNLLVPAQSQAHTSFPFDGNAGFYEARLLTETWDALALDDVAYAGNRDLRVLLTPPSPLLERALFSIPGVAIRVAQRVPVSNASYDVLVQTGNPPETLPEGRSLYFAPRINEPNFQKIADWDRSDPLMRFVDLTGVTVGLAPSLPPLPAADWRVLAQTDELEPAVTQLKTSVSDTVLLRFNPTQSDMTSRAAFPILITNIMEGFRGENRLTFGATPPTAERILIDGTEVTDLRRVVQAGIYRLDDRLYSASLLSARETRIPAALEVANTAETVATSSRTERQRNIGLWLVLAALIALVAEWLLWSRGSGGWMVRT